MDNGVYLRKVTEDDMMLLFKWANDPIVRNNSFQSKQIHLTDHKKWFSQLLNDSNQIQYILMRGDSPVGQIRASIIDRETALINYSIDEKYRGLGYGSIMIDLLKRKIHDDNDSIQTLIGHVKPENAASKKCFEKNGFIATYVEYRIDV